MHPFSVPNLLLSPPRQQQTALQSKVSQKRDMQRRPLLCLAGRGFPSFPSRWLEKKNVLGVIGWENMGVVDQVSTDRRKPNCTIPCLSALQSQLQLTLFLQEKRMLLARVKVDFPWLETVKGAGMYGEIR